MKKTVKKILALLLIALCFGLCACDEEEETSSSSSSSSSTTTTTQSSTTTTKKKSTVDLDLTKMSSTMVYSEVNNIMTNPDDYLGKRMKIKGTFAYSEGYYYVLIADATACCSQGIEFILQGDPSLDEYPARGEEFVVVGKFEKYYEGSKAYYHLVNAAIV